MSVLFFVAGLALLVAGAELLVRGAAGLALSAGVSPLVVGLTLVAYGTSSPELAVSIQSAMSGQSDLAIGNVVGSNIFNTLFILGISALIVPLLVDRQVVRQEVPVMIGLSFLLWWLASDGRLALAESLGLLAFLGVYTVLLVVQSRRESAAVPGRGAALEEPAATPRAARSWPFRVTQALLGLVLLVVGSRWLVASAIDFARYFGVSELIIGLTIVAAGTSLPEVATSVLAAIRGERDIAVGNVIGSNIFNIAGVLGAAGLAADGGLVVAPSLLEFDIPVTVAVAVACLVVFAPGRRIARWQGGLFLGYYFAYTAYLILYAQHHDALDEFSGIMIGFVLPITVITVVVLGYREWRGAVRGT